MNKIYICGGILLSHKQEWNNVICSNIDGPKYYDIKWSKSDNKTQISYDIAHMSN